MCILRPYGEIISTPFEVQHTKDGLREFTEKLQRLDGEIRVTIDATGIYHLPVFSYLHDRGIFVAVVNPLEMKRYACKGIRRVKTDKKDAAKADAIYTLATASITTLASSTPSAKMSVEEAVRTLNAINNSLNEILTRMKSLAKTLPEYSVVRSMGGIGEVPAPKLIAEIGDVRKFHSGKALVAYAGIDAPPYQSGQFYGTNRKISKRGSCLLRKTGYEAMRVLKSHKEPEDAAVYRFIVKKEAEGKPKKVAKIAGLNKFLRIYYARVMEVYKD